MFHNKFNDIQQMLPFFTRCNSKLFVIIFDSFGAGIAANDEKYFYLLKIYIYIELFD